jgi:hypothetical protein
MAMAKELSFDVAKKLLVPFSSAKPPNLDMRPFKAEDRINNDLL